MHPGFEAVWDWQSVVDNSNDVHLFTPMMTPCRRSPVYQQLASRGSSKSSTSATPQYLTQRPDLTPATLPPPTEGISQKGHHPRKAPPRSPKGTTHEVYHPRKAPPTKGITHEEHHPPPALNPYARPQPLLQWQARRQMARSISRSSPQMSTASSSGARPPYAVARSDECSTRAAASPSQERGCAILTFRTDLPSLRAIGKDGSLFNPEASSWKRFASTLPTTRRCATSRTSRIWTFPLSCAWRSW